ncbi:MAG TPA: 16S rRNA (cytosine(1402)-N(4))-methyltransferase RsmH [Vicinamibacterales bacterium]|nr:16S rRNA (cytosine(1402)-N(4))-methyltransferase RsmH [Vicinamibacterales bacterium]HPW20201.1 16S rRNA (cytosine(1402)-N(4))-methyltransferase RsmH [Vicinamibacterales bacterium]
MPVHVPVMAAEVVEALRPARGGLFVDCTVGAGGHARALLAAGATRLVGIDRDGEALDRARETLAEWGDRVALVHGDYRDLARLLDERGVMTVDGAVADLGVSSLQLDGAGRGFSFRRDEALDMRMDTSRGPTAADLVASAGEQALSDVIFRFGEERRSRAIAHAIVEARRTAPVDTTARLAAIVRRVVGRSGRIDPATRTFQAIRIWVNGELDGLEAFVRTACGRLGAGARLGVITFHSLEDRPVKHTLRALAGESGPLRLVTKKAVVPGAEERRANPRARSARLRVIERME